VIKALAQLGPSSGAENVNKVFTDSPRFPSYNVSLIGAALIIMTANFYKMEQLILT
jgi:hypothetical protein